MVLGRKQAITALIGFVLLAVVVTLVVDKEETASKQDDVIEHDYTFKGESKHWTAVFHVDGEEVFYEEEEVTKRDRKVESEFRLTYKGELDELASVKDIRYEYRTPRSSTGRSLRLDDAPLREKVFTDSGNTLVREDEIIEVTVEWGDSTETFTLEAEQD